MGRHDVSTTLFLVFRNPGPSWVPGLSSRQQPLWEEHAHFMDRLFEQGRIVLGGPYADSSRVLLVVQARDAAEASDLFRGDPWAPQPADPTPRWAKRFHSPPSLIS